MPSARTWIFFSKSTAGWRRCTPSISPTRDRKSTRLNSSHTEIYTLSLHDALPILKVTRAVRDAVGPDVDILLEIHRRLAPMHAIDLANARSEEHTSELQSHRDLHSFPTRRSSDLESHARGARCRRPGRGYSSRNPPPAGADARHRSRQR